MLKLESEGITPQIVPPPFLTGVEISVYSSYYYKKVVPQTNTAFFVWTVS